MAWTDVDDKGGAEIVGDERAAGQPPERWIGRLAGRRVMSRTETRLARLGLRPSLELSLTETIELLERKHATWGRADVVEALSVVLPTGNAASASAVHRAVEAAADLLLDHPDIVMLTCPDRPDVRHGCVRYSTRWTLQTEQAILDVVEARRTAGVAIAPSYRILAEAGLGDDRAKAVRRLCMGGERVATACRTPTCSSTGSSDISATSTRVAWWHEVPSAQH